MHFELVKEYWDIIIVHSRPKNGIITIQPFELIWKTKQQLNNIYGDWNTQTFFLQQLMDDMKEDDNNEEVEEIVPEFEHNEKVKLEDVINELPEIIHKEFDYFNYSELDKSNERFIRKQENTNQMREQIFINDNNYCL